MFFFSLSLAMYWRQLQERSDASLVLIFLESGLLQYLYIHIFRKVFCFFFPIQFISTYHLRSPQRHLFPTLMTRQFSVNKLWLFEKIFVDMYHCYFRFLLNRSQSYSLCLLKDNTTFLKNNIKYLVTFVNIYHYKVFLTSNIFVQSSVRRKSLNITVFPYCICSQKQV